MAPLQSLFEAQRSELERSEKVQRQLRDVLEMLAKRGAELAAGNAQLRDQAEARADPGHERLKQQVGERRVQCEDIERQHGALLAEVAAQRRQTEEAEKLAEERRAGSVAAEAAAERLERERREADARREEASVRARSMVSGETLGRVSEEADLLRGRLEEQEAEAARLRQALMDSWAARGDLSEAQPKSALQDLDGVEEELRWLARMQQESAADNHRAQSLERQEVVLQSKVRELSEEKAALQSARVDLGAAGGTMREAIAYQSEGWVKRVDDLEQKRKTTDQDRVKLINEIADAQARLDAIAPELESIEELETRHAGLQGDRRRLTDESQRLRDVNGALGVLLLGSDAPPGTGGEGDAGAVAQALTRVLQLMKRLNERQGAQSLEKDKLVDRIRELERQAAQPGADDTFVPPPRAAAAPQATPPTAAPTLATATSAVGGALRGGWGRLRDATADALL